MRKGLRCHHWIWLALLAKFGLDVLGIWVKKKRAKSTKKPEGSIYVQVKEK